ncbi:hypothetical protein WR25_19252 [Diploscapter pachys]|uniref:C-type lectin domain-containing protein n=1 Tax=Diploscapter pachys TaxID=2018661 RepID=A0A2A2L7L1_9BILA|nr:hypothetical protein WR25_19252 [Diploscapter pachys]
MNCIILLLLAKCSNSCLPTTPSMDLPSVETTTEPGTTESSIGSTVSTVSTMTTSSPSASTMTTSSPSASTMTTSSSSTTTTTTSSSTTTTTVDCFADSAPLAQCEAQCSTGWDFVDGKCYQFVATGGTWDMANAYCTGLCPSGMCHLPRLYSAQQGTDLYNYRIWIGTVGMARAESANVKAWSRFSYGDRDKPRTFACISTSHDHYINPGLE